LQKFLKLHICNSFVGQANNKPSFFINQDILVKLKLFQSYFSSFYGCELWSLKNTSINVLCTAWCKALPRVLKLPYNFHSYLLLILSCSLPLFDEIIKRPARLIIACLFHLSPRSVGLQHVKVTDVVPT